MKSLKLRMKSVRIVGRSKRGTTDRKLLIENNNEDIPDGNNRADAGYSNLSAPAGGQETLQEVAKLLRVAPDASEAGPCCSLGPETISDPENLKVGLIQRSVSRHLPKPDPDQKLQQHLFDVQEAVHSELARLGPPLGRMGLMGCLVDCYHRRIFEHLDDLLQNTSSVRNSLVLMQWVLQTYLGQEVLGHPDLAEWDPRKTVDQLLYTAWVEDAKSRLLDNVKKEFSLNLEKILQMERENEGCDNPEACVGFYIDTIQCTDAMPVEALKISARLSADVREVCFQELQMFLERYTTELKGILEKKAEMEKPELIHFFKTLKACKELKQHIQTQSQGVSGSLLRETVQTLEDMEAFTLMLLRGMVSDMAEKHLKSYFRKEGKQFMLIHGVKTYFTKLPWCQDLQTAVMDESYKLIAHVYLKHLIKTNHSKLARRWRADVGQIVTADAHLLHAAITAVAPGVQQRNLVLLKTTELLECQSLGEVKDTVRSMETECLAWSEDVDLLPALLRWKGLSGRQVREVLDDLLDQQSRSWSCLSCW